MNFISPRYTKSGLINLNHIVNISKDDKPNKYYFYIFFSGTDGNDHVWKYDNEEDRDAEYELLLKNISRTQKVGVPTAFP